MSSGSGDFENKEPTAVVNISKRKQSDEHSGIFGESTELVFASVCGVLLLSGWLTSFANFAPAWIPLAFYIGAYFFGSYFIVGGALKKLFKGRFEIDFLMLAAAIGAAILGAWAEGALLLFLFSVGHALEHYAMGRARHAIEALADLAPTTALVRRDGREFEIGVSDLAVGDIIIIKPDERIAADGFVVLGSSSVDQAAITGESIPVDKRPVVDRVHATKTARHLSPEHLVFAGTINQYGALEVQVTQVASESALAHVVALVSQAETRQSPTQRFTENFERRYVPIVISIAVLLVFAFLVVDENFSTSFYRAMAVLIAASPCALAISTPSAVLSGVARAARGGVLIKGGDPLESLGRVRAIAFDKTGTLTNGTPRITDVVPYHLTSELELLTIAIAVERLSDHPLAAAIVRDGMDRIGSEPVPLAMDMESITGRGVKATVDGQVVYVGKDALFRELDETAVPPDLTETLSRLESSGRTTMIVRRGNQYLGVVGLMDTPREAAKAAISQLRKLGIEKMLMISGDNQQVADAVAREVGLDQALGNLMPADKVETIKRLRMEQEVAMVGDGVNDAPAMANASVGIAMGAAGSDVALETADVALMADDLSQLPFAVGLSRQTSRIIRQNLFISLGMVIVLVPATIFGLRLGFAVLFHEGSTVAVVFNALRLLVYRKNG